jgi:glutamate carboxypeptidase
MSATEFRAYLTSMVADAKRLIECESPSADPDAIARSADEVARVGFARLGLMPDRIEIDGRVHLRWRFGSGPTRVLLLAHHDTVWPLGSLEKNPFAVTGDRLTGPGCFDMKAGIVMALHALASLHDRDGVTLLVTGDEEVGSPSSRSLIEGEASGVAAVLVLEAAAPGGAVKTERKGASFYEISIAGRAAHAGLEPERGINAVVELAHQVRRIAELGCPSLETSVTPTLVRGGSTSNTVPESATLAVDVRAWTMQELTRVDRELRALSAVIPGAVIALEGEIGRPPLESAASSGLFDLAQSVARRLGHAPLSKAAVGGASDGNFTAAMGVPTLDGLGAVGDGAHAKDEYVLIDRLPERTSLLAELLRELLATDR